MAKILLIEDDIVLGSMLNEWLCRNGHVVEWLRLGTPGSERLMHCEFDIAILDWNLPDFAGIDILRQYRNAGGKTAVIMASARFSIDEKERAFKEGADDYVTKPYDLREIGFRVQAILRRPKALLSIDQRSKGIALDYRNRQLVLNGAEIGLLPKEFSIVELLLRHPGHFFTAEQLLTKIWHTDSDASIDALRTCISRIRKKTEQVGVALIHTHRGYGYKIDPAEIESSLQQ